MESIPAILKKVTRTTNRKRAKSTTQVGVRPLTSPFFVFPPCLLFWSCPFLHSHLPFTDGMQWVGVPICIIYSSPGNLEKTKEQEYAEAASGCRQHREFVTSTIHYMVMHFTPGPFGLVVGYILPRKTRHSLPAFLFPPLHIRNLIITTRWILSRMWWNVIVCRK